MSSLLIRKIWQIDNYTFAILWCDDVEQHFRLSTLQKQCPCAQCVKEDKGRQRKKGIITEEVRALLIRSSGQDALQIKFTHGCSFGIYSFQMLRYMKQGE